MSELLRFSPSANATLPICVTDCFPGTTPDNTMPMNPYGMRSIGGVYLSNSTKVSDFDGACNGSVAAELGGAAPRHRRLEARIQRPPERRDDGPDLVLDVDDESGHRLRPHREQQDARRRRLAHDDDRQRSEQLDRALGPDGRHGRAIRRWLVEWHDVHAGARLGHAARLLENPTTITTAKWGQRDDPFRTHLNGDIVWAWFDAAGSTTLKFARVHSGGTAPSCLALP